METWVIVSILVAGALGAILAFRVKFDVNAWLKSRSEAKHLKEIGKRSEKCRHAWMLYPSASHSQCTLCQAWTSTAVLLSARQFGREDMRPIIMGEMADVTVTHKKPYITVANYMGRRDDD